MAAEPLVYGDVVIVGRSDGVVAAYRRASGALAWQRAFQGKFWGQRIVAAGSRLIVPHAQLHGLDATTGALLWTYQGVDGRAGINAPVVSGDTVFVADYGGRAAALDAASGAVIWDVDVGEVLFTPSLSADLVLYGTRGFMGGPGIGPLGAGHLIALDRATGEERWRVALPDSAGFPRSGGATNGGFVVDERVILGTMSSRILALRLSDGSLLWEQTSGTPYGEMFGGDAAVESAGAFVLARNDGRLEARETAAGDLLWGRRLSSSIMLRGTCPSWLCYGFGRVWFVDPNGNLEWAYGGGSSGTVFLSAPAIDDEGYLYAGVEQGGSTTRFVSLRLPPNALPSR